MHSFEWSLQRILECSILNMTSVTLPENTPEHPGPAVARPSQPVQALVHSLNRSQPAISETVHNTCQQSAHILLLGGIRGCNSSVLDVEGFYMLQPVNKTGHMCQNVKIVTMH